MSAYERLKEKFNPIACDCFRVPGDGGATIRIGSLFDNPKENNLSANLGIDLKLDTPQV